MWRRTAQSTRSSCSFTPGCARHSRQDPAPSPDPLPTGRAMLSTWRGGSASCCDADVGEAGQLDSSGSVSGHIRSARFVAVPFLELLRSVGSRDFM